MVGIPALDPISTSRIEDLAIELKNGIVIMMTHNHDVESDKDIR